MEEKKVLGEAEGPADRNVVYKIRDNVSGLWVCGRLNEQKISILLT